MPNTLEFAVLFCSFSDYQIFITTLGMVPIDEEDAPMASPPSEVIIFLQSIPDYQRI